MKQQQGDVRITFAFNADINFERLERIAASGWAENALEYSDRRGLRPIRIGARARLRLASIRLRRALVDSARTLAHVLDPRFDNHDGFVCMWCGQTTAEGAKFKLSCCRQAAPWRTRPWE